MFINTATDQPISIAPLPASPMSSYPLTTCQAKPNAICSLCTSTVPLQILFESFVSKEILLENGSSAVFG